MASHAGQLAPAEAVMRFLSSVGPNADAELYLKLFRERAPERFATIAVESDAVAQDADAVAAPLRFLQTLELTPVVVLGVDDEHGGEALRAPLAARLDELGVRTAPFDAGAEPSAVAAATRARRMPLLALPPSAQPERVAALSRLLTGLMAPKLIVLGPQGGLAAGGARLNVVNLTADYAALVARTDLSARDRGWLEISRTLVLERGGDALLVSLTSPLNLMRELFTVKGAGTLLRKGARIARHLGYAGVDLERLRALLTSSFGRAPRAELFDRPLAHCYLESGYRGAALLVQTPLGGYLSKFAVTREAQGEGIGQDLMAQVVADYPALFWRARSDNPVRAWYERTCQGRYTQGEWTVYVRGMPSEQLPEAIAYAVAQPVDF